MQINKILSFLLTLTFLLTALGGFNAYALETSYQNVGLITPLASSTTSGSVQFYLNVPAGRTVTYEVYRDYYYGVADKTTGYISNTGSTTLKKLVKVPLKKIGNYKIKASHTYGGIWDEDTVLSKFSGTKYSTKQYWNDAAIANYHANQALKIVATYAVSIPCDIYITKGKASAVATSIYFAKDIYGAATGEIASEETIQNTPIKNYSWRIKSVASTSTFKNYLEVYNASGVLSSTRYLGTYDFNRFSN